MSHSPWIGLVLVITLAASAPGSEDDTRAFDGVGSIGTGSSVEVFLLEGSYRHEIVSGCTVAASLFPGPREPAVPLGDVLQADLRTDGGRPDEGTVRISSAGWVHLQVGTGPECAWSYAIAGVFLPVGEEPGPPRAGDDLGPVGGLVAVVVVLLIGAALVLRIRPRGREAEPDEPRVRVTTVTNGPLDQGQSLSDDGDAG